jgi:hypothetical protein
MMRDALFFAFFFSLAARADARVCVMCVAAAQTVRRLVADASLLASHAAGSGIGGGISDASSLSCNAPLSAADACAALEPMHARHLATHLPVREPKKSGSRACACSRAAL